MKKRLDPNVLNVIVGTGGNSEHQMYNDVREPYVAYSNYNSPSHGFLLMHFTQKNLNAKYLSIVMQKNQPTFLDIDHF